LLVDRIAGSKPSGLARVAALLQDRAGGIAEFLAHDARGRHLPEYLTQLAAQLEADQRVALEELRSLRANIEHIKDTVTMQQSYAKLCGVTETVAVAALIDDSLRMNAGALARHGISLDLDVGDLPPITVDKHRVLQILVNLIRNAKHACEDSNRDDKRIGLRAWADGERIKIAVSDNGVGIAAEHLPRLFSHGFTTRASGHGFGLHSGALTARELGGSLAASSAGPGCGASFTLDLPRTPRSS
jgi:signal transduction histidine kinase